MCVEKSNGIGNTITSDSSDNPAVEVLNARRLDSQDLQCLFQETTAERRRGIGNDDGRRVDIVDDDPPG